MKKKTFASLSHSAHEGSLSKPLALVFLLCVLFVLAATQAHSQADGMAANGPEHQADSPLGRSEVRDEAATPRVRAAVTLPGSRL